MKVSLNISIKLRVIERLYRIAFHKMDTWLRSEGNSWFNNKNVGVKWSKVYLVKFDLSGIAVTDTAVFKSLSFSYIRLFYYHDRNKQTRFCN